MFNEDRTLRGVFTCVSLPDTFCSSAGGHHNHGHGGVVEVSEAKGEVDAALGTSGNNEHSHEQLHACIGVSLVLGFVFMLLVDQIGSSHMHSTEGRYVEGQQVQFVELRLEFVMSPSTPESVSSDVPTLNTEQRFLWGQDFSHRLLFVCLV